MEEHEAEAQPQEEYGVSPRFATLQLLARECACADHKHVLFNFRSSCVSVCADDRGRPISPPSVRTHASAAPAKVGGLLGKLRGIREEYGDLAQLSDEERNTNITLLRRNEQGQVEMSGGDQPLASQIMQQPAPAKKKSWLPGNPIASWDDESRRLDQDIDASQLQSVTFEDIGVQQQLTWCAPLRTLVCAFCCARPKAALHMTECSSWQASRATLPQLLRK